METSLDMRTKHDDELSFDIDGTELDIHTLYNVITIDRREAQKLRDFLTSLLDAELLRDEYNNICYPIDDQAPTRSKQ